MITLVAVYGPNKANPEFIKNSPCKIELIGNMSIIIKGDFNIPLDYDLDILNYINKNNMKSHELSRW